VVFTRELPALDARCDGPELLTLQRRHAALTRHTLLVG
jgi:hypothetical protein